MIVTLLSDRQILLAALLLILVGFQSEIPGRNISHRMTALQASLVPTLFLTTWILTFIFILTAWQSELFLSRLDRVMN